jgi:hypothetical protein
VDEVNGGGRDLPQHGSTILAVGIAIAAAKIAVRRENKSQGLQNSRCEAKGLEVFRESV